MENKGKNASPPSSYWKAEAEKVFKRDPEHPTKSERKAMVAYVEHQEGIGDMADLRKGRALEMLSRGIDNETDEYWDEVFDGKVDLDNRRVWELKKLWGTYGADPAEFKKLGKRLAILMAGMTKKKRAKMWKKHPSRKALRAHLEARSKGKQSSANVLKKGSPPVLKLAPGKKGTPVQKGVRAWVDDEVIEVEVKRAVLGEKKVKQLLSKWFGMKIIVPKADA